MMLQELGFHKTSAFLPFPEYWAGKLTLGKLQKAYDGLDRLSKKQLDTSKGQLKYLEVGGKYSDHVMNHTYPKTLDKLLDYAIMRDIMGKAISIHLRGK